MARATAGAAITAGGATGAAKSWLIGAAGSRWSYRRLIFFIFTLKLLPSCWFPKKYATSSAMLK